MFNLLLLLLKVSSSVSYRKSCTSFVVLLIWLRKTSVAVGHRFYFIRLVSIANESIEMISNFLKVSPRTWQLKYGPNFFLSPMTKKTYHKFYITIPNKSKFVNNIQ